MIEEEILGLLVPEIPHHDLVLGLQEPVGGGGGWVEPATVGHCTQARGGFSGS